MKNKIYESKMKKQCTDLVFYYRDAKSLTHLDYNMNKLVKVVHYVESFLTD